LCVVIGHPQDQLGRCYCIYTTVVFWSAGVLVVGTALV
jgi:hypothetical protein